VGAWGLLSVGLGLGIVLTFISPQVGIPVGVVITLLGVILVIRAYHGKVREKFEINTEVDKENLIATLKGLKNTGRLEDVSPADVDLILLMSIELAGKHGHNDLTGLLADRASGVPLNELKIKPCSQCGIPRNQNSK